MEPGYLGVAAAATLTVAMLARPGTKSRPRRPGDRRPPRRRSRRERLAGHRSYPGDYTGPIRPIYSPNLDGVPDPGEVVWTWVPYEDDHRQGKDRPVLLIGRDNAWLLALMMTSKDHDRDPHHSSATGRRWMDVGSGAWDHRGRPSEVRLDRIIRVHPDDVRREGAVLDKELFDRIAHEVETLASGPDRW